MSFVHILTAYINMNMLVIAGYLSLVLYPIMAGLVKKTIAARSLLKMHYAVLSILFLSILFYPVLPENNTFYPSVQIWSAQSKDTFIEDYTPPDSEGFFVFPIIKRTESFDTNNAGLAVAGPIICLLLIGIINISRNLYKLFNIRKGSYLIRRRGSVSIYANDHIEVPFSYWLPGMANIIIPTELLGKRTDYKITLFHELQHHRNGDTKWLYFIWFLKLICIFNPCIHLWCRLISELQEFACDEVLVDQKKIDSQDYARCLFEAAKSSSGRRRVPVCATGLTLMVQRRLLKRRIEKMFKKTIIQLRWHTNLLVLILIIGLMTIISCAIKGAIQDRRITMERAASMAERARTDTDYPIMVNDLVLKELNAYLGTPEGREYIRAALDRMKYLKEGIEKKITEYGVPMESLAIPLVESGYQRLQKGKPGLGAGLWDFIIPTATKFGLKINDQVDERLDVDASTDAAMRYLLSNRRRFDDWELSILAYNIGESNVQKTIAKAGSRDVWNVSRAFFRNGNNYYAKFMAAVIIIKNPDSVADKSERLAGNDEIQLIWPMRGWVTSKYGYRISPFSNEKEFHNGIDIAARLGTPIVAAASGTVKEVEFSPNKGHYILLQHKNNFQTYYAQCEKILAKEGQAVKSGDIIATCGSSGKSTGPHLHFELRKDGEPINPEKYVEFN
jgi:membrane-bound lytic murein transglycosylase D